MAMVVFFFLKVDLPKNEEKFTFREEFNWVDKIFFSKGKSMTNQRQKTRTKSKTATKTKRQGLAQR